MCITMVMRLGTMCAYVVGVTFGLPATTEDPSENEVPNYDFPMVTRAQWHARAPKEMTRLATPVPFVVIHHSHSPGACRDNDQCSHSMRAMQDFHMDVRGWCDIGYNFAVGGNGKAYEGRGWRTVGAQALHFNTVSIGICLIGDWSFELPPPDQLKTAQKLIEAGVALGFIRQDYRLVGHRQVRDTKCPGDALFEEIQTWTHYSPFPNSAKDLVSVEELPISLRESLRNTTKGQIVNS